MDDVIVLTAYTFVKDDYGVARKTETTLQVFAKVESITRQEFYHAGRNGLNPAFKFTVFAGDYSGETVCIYNGNQYGIYRTFHVPGTDYIELYAERKGGTNGKENDD